MADQPLPITGPEVNPQSQPVLCPHCASPNTELFSLFSQFLLASQYYCRACHTVFEVVRWNDPPEPAAERTRVDKPEARGATHDI